MPRNSIIDRLKYFSGWSVRMEGMSQPSELVWDAIEEIERLRKLLKTARRKRKECEAGFERYRNS